jgi:hypothetical protein
MVGDSVNCRLDHFTFLRSSFVEVLLGVVNSIQERWHEHIVLWILNRRIFWKRSAHFTAPMRRSWGGARIRTTKKCIMIHATNEIIQTLSLTIAHAYFQVALERHPGKLIGLKKKKHTSFQSLRESVSYRVKLHSVLCTSWFLLVQNDLLVRKSVRIILVDLTNFIRLLYLNHFLSCT